MSMEPATLYTEERPWGYFVVLEDSELCKVKRIVVKPGQRLSLQLHHKRQEIWTIVKGTATVTLGEETQDYTAGQVVHIPVETAHRMANTTTQDVVFIEVQLGSYFGEDDIVRLQDDYQRL